MDFLTNTNNKHKSTSPSASQVKKNQQKKTSIEKKFIILSRLNKVNKLLTYPLMFIVVHIPFVTMLTEFKKVLCQELVFV